VKRKIIIGLAVYAVVFSLGGVYVLHTIGDATAELDRLVQLHQVEILREHYLLEIRRVQYDLTLRGTHHSRDFDTAVKHAVNMRGIVEACFSCHHEEPVLERIRDLHGQTELYQDALSRVFTIRADPERMALEKDRAFHVGEELISQVGQMISLTGARLEQATQESLSEIRDTRFALFALVGIAPLLSAALGYLFISSLTSPVKVLLRSTRKLKAGDLDHRVARLRDEFGELAGAFNEMAESLKEHLHKMQRAEQMAVVGKLAAGLAHEIKNPLAGIKVAMNVLGDEEYLSDEDKRVVRKVSQEISRLEGLMRSFLEFARPAKPKMESVDINALIDSALTFYSRSGRRTSAGGPATEFVKDLGSLPRTDADPMQLHQVFLNLVINAVDAMPDGGTLSVRTAFDAEEKTIQVEIADTGHGIDPKHADSIFQPFFTTKPKGTGLGLPICRQLVEQHGGTIEAVENAGGGTCFRIRLPMQTVSEDVAA
jgi:signal transduction histidine kinase